MSDERQAPTRGQLPDEARGPTLIERLAMAEAALRARTAHFDPADDAIADLPELLRETREALRDAAIVLDDAETELALRARAQSLSEALNRISVDASASLDAAEFIRRVAEECCTVVGSDAVMVLMRETDRWSVQYACGFVSSVTGLVIRHDQVRPLVRLLRRGRMIVRDAARDPRIDRQLAATFGVGSGLAIPLAVREELVGALVLLYRARPLPVAEDVLAFTKRVSGLVALALENRRLLDERRAAEAAAQRRAADAVESELVLTLLYRLAHELTATLDPKRVCDRLVQAATDILGVEGCAIWLRDPDEPAMLVCEAARQPDWGRSPVGLRLGSGQGVAGWVALHGIPAVVRDTRHDARFFAGVDAATGLQTRSLLAAPLRARDVVIGTLEVMNKRNGTFDAQDSALLETLAAGAAIAVDNARLVAELRLQAAELQARNEELNAFAHTVAHDLQNPLGLIIGFSAVLADGRTDMPPRELGRYLQSIQQHARKMSVIIQELLLLADVRRAERIELVSLDMAAIVHEARQRVAALAVEYRADVILPGGWPQAWGHPPWVEEVWDNYLSNGIKYGGRPPRLELGGATQPDGTVRFWVRDNGAGLSAEEQARLFQPFTRLDPVRATGHGLGLSVVRTIVERMGGQVGVESTPGQGSEFSFTLPGGPRQ